MKDWILANLFFVALALIAAGLVWAGVWFANWIGLDADSKRYVLALIAVCSIGVAGFAGALFLKTDRR